MIIVKDLAYTYPNSDTPAVHGLNFEISHGEIFGFLGPSGAGKSTTQKILIGLLKGYRGTATVFEKPLHEWGGEYYEQIGVSFELPNHYLKLSALENLNYFRSLYQRPTLAPLELLNLVGLDEDANKRVSDFSKGMQMRLNFIRALMHQPELLFLDEPTAGLDPANARTVKEIILDQKAKGRTVFLTTHNMTDAEELCDRVAFIVDGQLALVDTPRALKTKHSQSNVEVEYISHDKMGDPIMETEEFPLDEIGRNELFLACVRDHQVTAIRTPEASLDDIFIQVTGRTLQ